jgi:hypothetical protein
MGGTDTPDNLIRVNVALHAFLHKCLFEEYGNWQDEFAWKALSGQKPIKEIDEELEKIRAKRISDALRGRKKTKESKENMSKTAKIRANTPEGKAHLHSIANNGLGKKRSKETREKIGNKHRGRVFSEESRKKMSESAKRRSASSEYKLIFLQRIGRIDALK